MASPKAPRVLVRLFNHEDLDVRAKALEIVECLLSQKPSDRAHAVFMQHPPLAGVVASLRRAVSDPAGYSKHLVECALAIACGLAAREHMACETLVRLVAPSPGMLDAAVYLLRDPEASSAWAVQAASAFMVNLITTAWKLGDLAGRKLANDIVGMASLAPTAALAWVLCGASSTGGDDDARFLGAAKDALSQLLLNSIPTRPGALQEVAASSPQLVRLLQAERAASPEARVDSYFSQLLAMLQPPAPPQGGPPPQLQGPGQRRTNGRKGLLAASRGGEAGPSSNGGGTEERALAAGNTAGTSVAAVGAASPPESPRAQEPSAPPLPAAQQCALCGKTAADGARLKLCRGCRAVRFCSQECYKAVLAAGHRQECQALQAAAAAAAGDARHLQE